MGIISIAVQDSTRWYFKEVLRGVVARVEAASHTVLVHAIAVSDTSTAEAVAVIDEDFANPDSLGAIAAGFNYRVDASNRALTWQRPLVAIGGSVPGFPAVMIDDIGGARLATKHLLHLGHTKIAHLTEPLQNQSDFLVFGRRVKGYRNAMESAGLKPIIIEIEDKFSTSSAFRAALEILRRPSAPSGIFAASDEVAFAVLAAARELGLRLGHDLSVVGFDDLPNAQVEDLTTVRQVPADIGATAVDILLSNIQSGPHDNQSRLHGISLVTRGSTGRVPR